MRIGAVAGVILVLGTPFPSHPQEQQPRYQNGWPCTGRVDPAFVRTAETTGGKVLLFAPNEIGGAAGDMAASSHHPETVFRAGGELDDGVHDVEIPLDSTIESVYFYIALQCQQFAAVLRPDGDELLANTPGTESQSFQAVRLVTVKAPRPGTWKVRMAGRGFSSVIVAAKTGLALSSVSMIENGERINGAAPPGKRVRLEVATSGDARQVSFHFVSARGARLRTVELRLVGEADTRRTYAGDVTLPETAFRVLVSGADANGFPFARVAPQLFAAGR